MNNEHEQRPFSEVLDALLTNDPIPIYLLYRLSDMSDEEAAEFKSRWTAVAPEKRRIIIRHMADLTEDNFTVDFVPVFMDSFADPEPAVRIAALDGLWDATDTKLISPLIQLLQEDKSDEVRAAAAAALAHFVILAEWEQLPKKAAAPIIEALLAEYKKRETTLPVKRATLEALGAAHHPDIPDLISEAYESGSRELQISAVFAMGSSADKQWLAIVLAEMENLNPEMRVEAAKASGNLGSSDAISYLEKLVEDEDYEVRLTAVAALGQIGGDSAQEILMRLLNEPESDDLYEAIEEALEEMALFSGEFQLLDFDDEDLEDEA